VKSRPEENGLEITLPSLAAASAQHLEVIDIRTAAEVAAQPAAARHIAMPALLENPDQLSRDGRYLLVCASGKRSLATARELRKRGLEVHSLAAAFKDSGAEECLFDSKLPDVGTTIFTVMSRRALEEDAVTWARDSPTTRSIRACRKALIETIAEGRNQYAPMEGVVELRAAIANKLEASYARRFDPESEITVTCAVPKPCTTRSKRWFAPG